MRDLLVVTPHNEWLQGNVPLHLITLINGLTMATSRWCYILLFSLNAQIDWPTSRRRQWASLWSKGLNLLRNKCVKSEMQNRSMGKLELYYHAAALIYKECHRNDFGWIKHSYLYTLFSVHFPIWLYLNTFLRIRLTNLWLIRTGSL